MRIHNLYTDAGGQSHFRDIEVEWVEERRGSKLSKRLPATGVIFRETQAEHDIDWHPAPRRQYIINLDAGVNITASDGESSRPNRPARPCSPYDSLAPRRYCHAQGRRYRRRREARPPARPIVSRCLLHRRSRH